MTEALRGTPKSVAMRTNSGEIPKRSTLEVKAATAIAPGGRRAPALTAVEITSPPYRPNWCASVVTPEISEPHLRRKGAADPCFLYPRPYTEGRSVRPGG